MRYVFGMILFCCCGFYGFSKASGLKRRLDQLQHFQAFFFELKSKIRYGSVPLADICTEYRFRLAEKGESNDEMMLRFLQELLDGLDKGETFLTTWKGGVKNVLSKSFLTEEDLYEIEKIGMNLGNEDKKTQLEWLEYYGKCLEAQTLEAKEEKQEKTGLYQKLGVIAGAFLFISIL